MITTSSQLVSTTEAPLAVVVWLSTGHADDHNPTTLMDLAKGPWTMSANKVRLSRILVAVRNDVIVASWRISDYQLERWNAPTGRQLHRCSFELTESAELDSLIGQPSLLAKRKNPVAFMQLRDVPGFVQDDRSEALTGQVGLAGYILTAYHDGTVEVTVPAGKSLLVRSDDES